MPPTIMHISCRKMKRPTGSKTARTIPLSIIWMRPSPCPVTATRNAVCSSRGENSKALVIGHITDRVKSDFYDGNLWKGLDDSNVYEIHLDGIRLDGVNGKSRLEAVQDFDVYSVSVDHETMVIRMTLE